MYGKLYAGVKVDPGGGKVGRVCVYIFQESEARGAGPRILRHFPDIEEVDKLIDQLKEARRKAIVETAYREACEAGVSQRAFDLAQAIGRGSFMISDYVGLALSAEDLAYIRQKVKEYVKRDANTMTTEGLFRRHPYLLDPHGWDEIETALGGQDNKVPSSDAYENYREEKEAQDVALEAEEEAHGDASHIRP